VKRLDGPKVDEGVQEQIRIEYDAFDIEAAEESKTITTE